MDTDLIQLWTNAIAVSNTSGVPAPALVAGYLKIIAEHRLESVPAEAIDQVGTWIVEQFGRSAA